LESPVSKQSSVFFVTSSYTNGRSLILDASSRCSQRIRRVCCRWIAERWQRALPRMSL
jgi:hypothetical protein